LEVEKVYKVELLQALQWCLEVLRWLCESCFQKVYGHNDYSMCI